MSLDAATCLPRWGRWESVALIAWTVVTVGVVIRVAYAGPNWQTVYPVFKHAGVSWRAGNDLYPLPDSPAGTPIYRYSPLVAALLMPFSIIPDPLGAIIWRLVSEAALLAALAWWLRAVVPQPITPATMAVCLLLVMPLAMSNVNNAQANVLVIALLLAGVAAVAEERWWLAATFVALASFLKIYPLAVGLLLAAVFPLRFAPRLGIAILIGLLLPFAMQRPEYVMEQYSDWVRYLQLDHRSDYPIFYQYRDLRLLLRVWLTSPHPLVYLALQLGVAVACAVACVAANRHGWPRRRLLTLLLALGCSWMTLLGPSTESCTYLLVAPTAAWAVVEAWTARRPAFVHFLLWSGLGLFATGFVASWFSRGARNIHSLGVHPLGGLLILAAVLALEYLWWVESQRATASRRFVPASQPA